MIKLTLFFFLMGISSIALSLKTLPSLATWPTTASITLKNQSTSNHQRAWLQIHYQNAKNIAKFINDNKNSFLSSSGRLSFYSSSNQIFVDDTRHNIKRIKQLLHTIDKPKQSILIKALIVNYCCI